MILLWHWQACEEKNNVLITLLKMNCSRLLCAWNIFQQWQSTLFRLLLLPLPPPARGHSLLPFHINAEYLTAASLSSHPPSPTTIYSSFQDLFSFFSFFHFLAILCTSFQPIFVSQVPDHVNEFQFYQPHNFKLEKSLPLVSPSLSSNNGTCSETVIRRHTTVTSKNLPYHSCEIKKQSIQEK